LSYGYVPATSTYTTSSEHDAVTWSGSVPTVSVAGTFSSTAQLDSRGRPWTASGNNGQKATYSLDKQGNMLSVGDTISTTQWTPDALNRSGLQTNPDTGQLQYLYGTDGRFAGIRTPRGLTFSYKRNGLGDITESDNPDSGNIVYTPDSFGRVQTEARSNGTSITYGWDGLDRLTSRSSSGNTESYHYDEANGKGQLTSFSSVTGSRTYGFDTAGRITGQTDVIFGNSFGQSRTFNGAGQLVTQTYPSGLQLTYGYSTDGHLSSISSNVPSAPTLASQMVYQPAGGGLYAWHYGNGSNRNVFFDADGRVTTVQTPGIQNVSIAYYADNTVKSQTDVLRSTLTASYTYDPNKRLQSVTRTNDNQSFLWDVDSNRTSSTRAGAGTTYTYATDSNRLTSLNGVNVTYMTGGGDYYQVGTRSYSRDEFDRLSVAYLNGSSVGQYRYNVLDQRVYKSAATGVTYYVYDPEGRLIAESTNNSETDYVWLGSQLLALYRGGQMYYVSNDRLARPEVATNASNGIVWRAANAAFDRTVSTDAIGGLNISYPGQYFDSESGLYNNGRRYYESGTGRYIQSDPIGIVAGVNTYAYVNGNPLLRIDRRGLISSAAKEILIDLTFDVGAAIIVAACPECVLTALVIEAGGNLLGAGLAYYEGRHAIQKNEETKQTVDKQCH
jgi:RHS repeat-associated protein